LRRARGLAPVALCLALAACDQRRPSEAAAAGVVQAGPAVGAPILLGHVASLTGPEAGAGEATDRGIRLAVEEQNARGGVKGRLVQVRTYDDRGAQEEAALGATRLVAEEKVSVLLGEVASRRSLAMAPLADGHQVPMVTPSSTDSRVTRDGEKVRRWVFRACFADPFQGAAMAGFARRTLGLKQVAVLRDVGPDPSVGAADAFHARFKELGGAIVDDQSYRAGDSDFRAQLTAIRRKKPDAIYVPGASAEVAQIARQARELGLTVPLLGGDRWDSARLHELARGALEGSYHSAHWASDDPSPRVAGFVKRYQARYGVPPDSLAARGYDAAGVALEAMARATDLSHLAIRDALAATRAFPGVTGDLTIGPDHNPSKPLTLLRIQGERATFVQTILP
jgi:branched-chain amino acid transport system substrate-binding protein